MSPIATDQLTAAGRRIERDSFAIIDREADPHAYSQPQWQLVRRLIHSSGDFDFNGLTRCHPGAIDAGAPPELVSGIGTAVTARFAAERLETLGLAVPFHRALAIRALRSLRQRYPGPHRLCVLACDFDGRHLVRVEEDGLA